MEAGKRGPTGDTGRVGDTGRTGDTGAEGGPGTAGKAGAKGARGATGPRSGRLLFWLFGGAAILLMLVAATTSTISLLSYDDIQGNTARIAEAQKKLRAAQRKLAGVDALCVVAVQQRHALEQQAANSEQFLASPAAEEAPGLAAMVRTLTLPQLRDRLRVERPPEVCERIVRPDPK